jgi:hypothetical protein
LPLAGRATRGEVISLGDGMAAWYGSDFDTQNRALVETETDRKVVRAFKRALS